MPFESDGFRLVIQPYTPSGKGVVFKSIEIGLLDAPKLARNLWTQEDVPDFTRELIRSVQPHETILLKIEDK